MITHITSLDHCLWYQHACGVSNTSQQCICLSWKVFYPEATSQLPYSYFHVVISSISFSDMWQSPSSCYFDVNIMHSYLSTNRLSIITWSLMVFDNGFGSLNCYCYLSSWQLFQSLNVSWGMVGKWFCNELVACQIHHSWCLVICLLFVILSHIPIISSNMKAHCLSCMTGCAACVPFH